MAATQVSVSVVECLIDRAEEDIKSTNARLIKANTTKAALGQELVKITSDFVAGTITRLLRNTKTAEITDQLVKIEFRITDCTGHLSVLKQRCETFRESIRFHDCEAVLMNHVEMRDVGSAKDEAIKKLEETRAAMRIADAKTMAILARGTTCVIVPQESATPAATAHVSTQPTSAAMKLIFAPTPGIANTPYKHTIAGLVGWLKYMTTCETPIPSREDEDLMCACDAGCHVGALAAIAAGATDFDAGLAHACKAGHANQITHMLNIGAKDLQLGLACACYAEMIHVIPILIARGVVIDDNMIIYVGSLGNSAIRQLVFTGSLVRVSDAALARLRSIDTYASLRSLAYLQTARYIG